MTTYQVRPIRAEEWSQVRQLRLTALQDEVAHLAFTETRAEALARPDDFWQQRAQGSSPSADPEEDAGTTSRQWIVIADDGTWVGSTVALVEQEGAESPFGGTVARTGGHLVGVYLHHDHRGQGLLGRLFESGCMWLRERGLDQVRLFVHTDNARARAAYGKLGFSPSGVTATLAEGLELEMVRPL